MPTTLPRSSPQSSTPLYSVSAVTRRTPPSQKVSRRSIQPTTPRGCPAIPATSPTARPSAEKRNEHFSPPHASVVAGRRSRLEARSGRDPRGRSQLQPEPTLVGHVDRRDQMHWVRQLCARLPDGERRAGWILPHLGGALSRFRLRHRESPRRFSRWRQKGISSKQRRRREEFLRAQAVQSLRRFTVHASLSRRRDFYRSRWRGTGGQEILPRLPLLCAGLPLRLPLHQP